MSTGKSRVLVTGASGFLGAAICHNLSESPCIGLAALCLPTSDIQPGTLERIEISNRSDSDRITKAVQRYNPTEILHIAALSSPKSCQDDEPEAWLGNVRYTESLCSAASLCGSHLTFVSTDLVFDGAFAVANGFGENSQTEPASVYAKTKVAAEQYVYTLGKLGAVVRISLLFGYSPSSSRGTFGWMEDAFRNGKDLPLFSDEFRTPLYVEDATRMILAISESRSQGLWHCGGEKRISRLDFGKLVASVFQFDPLNIIECLRGDFPAKFHRPRDVSLNSEKFKENFGFGARALDEALKEMKNQKMTF